MMIDETPSQISDSQPSPPDVVLPAPVEAVDPALESFLDQFPAHLDAAEAVQVSEPACLRCQGPLQFLGTRSFDRGYQPDLTFVAIHAFFFEESIRVYACTVCGHIELFRSRS